MPKYWQKKGGTIMNIFTKKQTTLSILLTTLCCLSSTLNIFAISQGNIVVTGHRNGEFKAWDPNKTGDNPILNLKVADKITSLAVNPIKNNIVAIGSDSNEIFIYDISKDTTENKKSDNKILIQDNKKVTSLCFSPNDAKVLATALSDGSIKIYDITAKKLINSIQLYPSNKSYNMQIKFSPIKKNELACANNNEIKLLNIDQKTADAATTISLSSTEKITKFEFLKSDPTIILINTYLSNPYALDSRADIYACDTSKKTGNLHRIDTEKKVDSFAIDPFVKNRIIFYDGPNINSSVIDTAEFIAIKTSPFENIFKNDRNHSGSVNQITIFSPFDSNVFASAFNFTNPIGQYGQGTRPEVSEIIIFDISGKKVVKRYMLEQNNPIEAIDFAKTKASSDKSSFREEVARKTGYDDPSFESEADLPPHIRMLMKQE